MKRRLHSAVLACSILYAPTIAAESWFSLLRNNAKEFKDGAKELIDYAREQFTQAVKEVLETPDAESGAESPAKNFLNALDTMSDQKLAELKDFSRSLLTTGSFMGLTALTTCFAVYALHNMTLEYIQYKHASDETKKAVHADHIKYYATIASITVGLCGYSIYSAASTIEHITQTLPAPSAQ